MNHSTDDIFFMKRCLELASSGLGFVSPNPMVGCVITHNNKIIGEGYHRKYGEAHAEVNAINSVENKELLHESVLYVNLEPCSHYGKTPPCADLIIKHKIPRVIVASTDTNPLVGGKGIQRLRDNGCHVTEGLLDNKNKFLNRRFYTFHNAQRPYIILKWAQSIDGFIDTIRSANSPLQPNWITSEESRVFVHKLRTQEDAIMVGTQTVMLDNPTLTAREWEGKNPVKIVLDRNLTIPLSQQIFTGDTPVFIFNTVKDNTERHIRRIKADFGPTLLKNICNTLYKDNIQSLIVEGGAFLLNSFIEQGLWDETMVFSGPVTFESGIKAPIIKNKSAHHIKLNKDTLSTYYNYEQ